MAHGRLKVGFWGRKKMKTQFKMPAFKLLSYQMRMVNSIGKGYLASMIAEMTRVVKLSEVKKAYLTENFVPRLAGKKIPALALVTTNDDYYVLQGEKVISTTKNAIERGNRYTLMLKDDFKDICRYFREHKLI